MYFKRSITSKGRPTIIVGIGKREWALYLSDLIKIALHRQSIWDWIEFCIRDTF